MNYASIPFAVEQKDLELDARRTGLQTPLLAASAPDSSTIEAIRSLRTSLYFAMLEAPNNIVMLTGPSPGLGKSFITANLGAVLASAGKRVVVVDADLRRGQLHRYLSTTRSTRQGISEFVSGAAEFEAVVCPTGVSGLSLVARGATVPNPAELLLNSRFAHFMKMLSDNFDYVLLDTPPALAVTDAAIIGALAANSFVVLKSGAHPLREIGEVLMRLKRAGVVVTGAIFNQTSQRAGYYGYGRYTYRYDTYRSN